MGLSLVAMLLVMSADPQYIPVAYVLRLLFGFSFQSCGVGHYVVGFQIHQHLQHTGLTTTTDVTALY